MADRNRPRFESPPPSTRTAQDSSLFRRISLRSHFIVTHLTGAVASLCMLESERSHAALSISLEFAKLGLTAYFVFLTGYWLRKWFPGAHVLLTQVTSIAGSSTELALAFRLQNNGKTSEAEMFLLGSAYAKPLAIGALYLLVQSIKFRGRMLDPLEGMKPQQLQLFRYGGLLVIASATHAQDSWIGQVLLITVIVGTSYMQASSISIGHGHRRHSNLWILPLLAILCFLKGFAIYSLYNLLEHVENRLGYADASVYFISLPLLAVVVDSVTVLQPSAPEAWRSIITTTVSNYLLARLFAAVAGHEVVPARGQKILGVFLMATAICLSVHRLPLIVRASALLLAYAGITLSCIYLPEYFYRFVV